MRTLVVHFGGIGDFLLASPALRELSKTGPLELAGHRDRMELARVAGLAEVVHDLDHVDFASVFSTPSDRFRAFVSRFDRAIVWMRDDGRIETALRGCGLPDVSAFPGLPPETWTRHASGYYLDCLGFSEAPPFRLDVEPLDAPFDVIIHAGSGGAAKNWPLDRFRQLADTLRERGRTVTWSAGPAEEEWWPGDFSPVLRPPSLVALARALRAAAVYTGNDSGVTHLAAAVGCRTVALFGPTDPAKWAPLGENVSVLRGHPWPELETVLAHL